MPRQILLADDSATIARMVQIAFAHEDYQVTVAKGADEALARARASRPDVILVDAALPGQAGQAGKNGYDLCSELRAGALRDVPVLILSSNFVPYDEARGQRAGADGFVVKPFETQALIDRVGQAVGQRGGASASAARPGAQTTGTPSPGVPAAPYPPSASRQHVSQSPAAPSSVTPVSVPASSRPPQAPRSPTTMAIGTPPQPQPPPAAPPPRPSDVLTNARPAPRATLMGLPTVGPDGLPIFGPPPAAFARPAAPPPAAPPPAARAPQPAEPVEAQARASPTPPPVTGDFATRPMVDRGPPAPAPLPAEATAPAAPRPVAPSVAAPPAAVSPPAATTLIANAPVLPPPERALPALPADAPRMPRPSLVPNAPSPQALRQLVKAVASAATNPLGQPLGAYPEYEAIARLARDVIEQIAWEVVPELAEQIIRAQLDRLVQSHQSGKGGPVAQAGDQRQ